MVDPTYDDIIWFPQGVFILTSCKMNQTTNNYTITIDGKDKMCKLNGDLGGSITAQTDFDIIEEVYKSGDTPETVKTKLPLKTIIREMLISYGELPENIIINDLDDDGLELLEYRYEARPLYLFKEGDGEIHQITLNGDMEVETGTNTSILLSEITCYDNGNSINGDSGDDATKVWFTDDESKTEYTVMRYTYGDLAGYRPTLLIYPG
jgi:hypothetical protein